MNRILIALAVPTVFLLGSPASITAAQEGKSARGTVTAITGDSLTINARGQSMKFSIDAKTHVEAVGAGTKARQATAAGKPGVPLADVLKSGEAVEVSYNESSGGMHATRIRRVASLETNAAGAEAKPAESSIGTVKSVNADLLTISGSSGGGATFTQTFAVDANTKVVGVGAGTATAAKGGRISITELVAAGDRVSVSYRKSGTTLHADDVRVTRKAARGATK
jgi:uncharacterized protein DUF5666